MTPEERDQNIISRLVRIAPIMVGIAGGAFLYAMWSSAPLSLMSASSEIIVSGVMLTFSYGIWQRRVGYAWAVPGLFLALAVLRVSRAHPQEHDKNMPHLASQFQLACLQLRHRVKKFLRF